MLYITTRQTPRTHQMTLDEFLTGVFDNEPCTDFDETGTRTYIADGISRDRLEKFDIDRMVETLHEFNRLTEPLHLVERSELYRTFYIPKKSHGFRRIDAPNDELMDALRRLKTIFEKEFYAMYHTSAFAYVKGRCAVDAVKKHQSNVSKWFGKFDCSDFFGSITEEFLMNQLSMIFPFSEVIKREDGKRELSIAANLCFLNGGLPQGTPISPLLTNIIMIPIDHELSNGLKKMKIIYTRYADDILVSSKYTFNVSEVQERILTAFRKFNAPLKLNTEKTRYGSSAGSNWNLGVMLNKDNNITIGYKRKRQFQAALNSFVLDTKNGMAWNPQDVMVLGGLISYYRSVEGDTIDRIIEHIGNKYNADIKRMIAESIKP